MSDPITITIPLAPHAQGRVRATAIRGRHRVVRARVYDPARSRAWKAAARIVLTTALRRAKARAFAARVPVGVALVAIYPCPKARHRVKSPASRTWHVERGDCDNIAKAVLDAANGVLWHDDAQVAALHVRKVVAAQGEQTRVVLSAWELQPSSAAPAWAYREGEIA